MSRSSCNTHDWIRVRQRRHSSVRSRLLIERTEWMVMAAHRRSIGKGISSQERSELARHTTPIKGVSTLNHDVRQIHRGITHRISRIDVPIEHVTVSAYL